MKRAVVVGVALFLFAGVAWGDPIDDVVAKIKAEAHLWENGAFPEINLNPNASTAQVVAKVWSMTNFPGKQSDYKILEIQKVKLPGSYSDIPYTAVLARTGGQGAVVLVRNVGMWWSRIFEVTPDKMPSSK